MELPEARRILFAAVTTWANAQLEFEDQRFSVAAADLEKVQAARKLRSAEVSLRAQIMDAAVEQYARILAEKK